MSFLKRLERSLAAPFKLGRTEWMSKQAFRGLNDLHQHIAALRAELADFRDQIQHQGMVATDIRDQIQHQGMVATDIRQSAHDLSHRLDTDTAHMQGRLSTLQHSLSDLTRRLDQMLLQGPPVFASEPKVDEAPGFANFKDQFYHALEERYRGTEDEIARRLKIYLPEVEAAVMRSGSLPILDLGCGRGEWLSLLEARALPAWGVDTNPVQIAGARERGLDAREGDALNALSGAGDNSLSVITAHHLIEHLPFDHVAWIVREALRVLAPGGLLLMETPNTRNVLVGATTFHTDPTHRKPMPEQVMSVLLETAGFHPVDCRGLNAHERHAEFLAMSDMNDELAFLLFGPQDLAILGTKPMNAA